MTFGGYSESIVVDEAFVLKIPKNLDLAATAPLLCAGITTYSPLRHHKVSKGQKVGIVGLGGLEQALDQLGDLVSADIHFQPFELNPDMPPEGENTTEHVQKKYGADPARSAASRNAIRDSGEALGFRFAYDANSRIWNTFDAHRLLYWAGIEGRQLELKEALFTVNFTEQKSTSDHEVLIGAAKTAGLDADKARDVLTSGAYTAEVRHEEDVWRNRGISAVPSVMPDTVTAPDTSKLAV